MCSLKMILFNEFLVLLKPCKLAITEENEFSWDECEDACLMLISFDDIAWELINQQ